MKAREAENRFIEQHLKKSTAEVALILSKQTELDKEYILRQLNGRQKATKKFPFLADFPEYEFPSPRSVAQASSQEAAEFKAGLLSNTHQKIADLSGGMGIDCYFLSKGRKGMIYLEPDPILFEITKANFKVLGADHIQCINRTAAEFLSSHTGEFDLIYLDPDRRKEDQRLIRLEDCEPNAVEMQKDLFKISEELMIKFSPLLDIKLAMQQLKGLKEIVILSIKNECKELLFLLQKNWTKEAVIRAIDLEENKAADFVFTSSEESKVNAEYSEPLSYLYEPNAAIMKAGAFNLLAKRFHLKKLAPNTHLYTSSALINDFPGRSLHINKVDKSPKIAPKQVNLVNRNSGMSVAQMKKKYKLKDGGDLFLYACRLEKGKRVFLLCKRVIRDKDSK
jgi:16S rRNA G966 N2-methylase RsmD